MRNIKLTLEYDGTNYSGWQKQAKQNIRTIQGEIELALSTLLGEPIKVNSAGRTDAGVHAFGQVISFKTASDMPIRRIPYSLNAILPDDIVAKDAEEVSDRFDARKDAKWREYHYYILNRFYRSVFAGRFVHHEARPLDVEAMDKAVSFLKGRHDFTSFYTMPHRTEDVVDSPVRTILEISCKRSKDIVWAGEPVDGLITIRVRAHAFLHNMVRIIAGTVIDVGLGMLGPEDMRTILEARDRRKAGATAPAKGLTLVKVHY
ncbi:MAG: tRNA pseudouridine(38-40) synthase TruA [Actinomycetota bacterium]|nr:tRNA pseudouridine(38-40) synthase TruA [Actinomycetota bacterium]